MRIQVAGGSWQNTTPPSELHFRLVQVGAAAGSSLLRGRRPTSRQDQGRPDILPPRVPHGRRARVPEERMAGLGLHVPRLHAPRPDPQAVCALEIGQQCKCRAKYDPKGHHIQASSTRR
eukprot:2620123-Rhodomonas_salina.3